MRIYNVLPTTVHPLITVAGDSIEANRLFV